MTSSSASFQATSSPNSFRATLLDGREVDLQPVVADRLTRRPVRRGGTASRRTLLVSPIAAPTSEQSAALDILPPIRWQATVAGGAIVGEGWFARHAGSPDSALLSLVVDRAYAGTGLARLLLETLVLGALEHRLTRVYALLPEGSDEFTPVLQRLQARVARSARGALMATIDLSPANRQLRASGPLARMRAAC